MYTSKSIVGGGILFRLPDNIFTLFNQIAVNVRDSITVFVDNIGGAVFADMNIPYNIIQKFLVGYDINAAYGFCIRNTAFPQGRGNDNCDLSRYL